MLCHVMAVSLSAEDINESIKYETRNHDICKKLLGEKDFRTMEANIWMSQLSSKNSQFLSTKKKQQQIKSKREARQGTDISHVINPDLAALPVNDVLKYIEGSTKNPRIVIPSSSKTTPSSSTPPPRSTKQPANTTAKTTTTTEQQPEISSVVSQPQPQQQPSGQSSTSEQQELQEKDQSIITTTTENLNTTKEKEENPAQPITIPGESSGESPSTTTINTPGKEAASNVNGKNIHNNNNTKQPQQQNQNGKSRPKQNRRKKPRKKKS